jgi:hypothetical protein
MAVPTYPAFQVSRRDFVPVEMSVFGYPSDFALEDD